MEANLRPVWRSRAWIVALTVLMALLVTVPALNPAVGIPVLVIILVVMSAAAVGSTAWALARTRHRRQEFEERLADWFSERAVQEERMQIARDLHDLASHGLGLITIRASAANLADDDSERRQALADIEAASREATDELRQMLTLLRGTSTTPALRTPSETLSDLPAIIVAAERTGLTVRRDVDGLGDVAAPVQLTICAIIREALDNAARHAGPTAVDITIRRRVDMIEVDLRDHGIADGWSSEPGAGHGLVGLRERVDVLKGTLVVGPDSGGFRIQAHLPAGRAHE